MVEAKRHTVYNSSEQARRYFLEHRAPANANAFHRQPLWLLAFFALAISAFAFFGTAYAGENLAEEGSDIFDANENQSYLWPDIKNIAQMYWSVGKFNTDDDEAIDNYISIQDCDLYTEYYSNEFEWRTIRESMRKYLKASKKQFPVRFKFMQPLNLDEYDTEKQMFEVAESYKMNGVRRFQILPLDYNTPACRAQSISNYERGLAVEMSRPLTLLYLPIGSGLATEYIESKMPIFKSMLDSGMDSKTALTRSRTAYIVMMVKVFAYSGTDYIEQGAALAKVSAVLEGFEVYADLDMKQLLYAKYFRNHKKKLTKPSQGAAKLPIPTAVPQQKAAAPPVATPPATPAPAPPSAATAP